MDFRNSHNGARVVKKVVLGFSSRSRLHSARSAFPWFSGPSDLCAPVSVCACVSRGRVCVRAFQLSPATVRASANACFLARASRKMRLCSWGCKSRRGGGERMEGTAFLPPPVLFSRGGGAASLFSCVVPSDLVHAAFCARRQLGCRL